MFEFIHRIDECLDVTVFLICVGFAFFMGLGLGTFLMQRLFKRFQGKESGFTSRGNSVKAWDKVCLFVYDRYKLFKSGAINPCPGNIAEDKIDTIGLSEEGLFEWLRSSPGADFLWLCNFLGIRVDFSTKEEPTEEELSDADLKYLRDHLRSWHGRLPTKFYSISLLLLSGGALLSIIAFVLVIVMC